MIKNKAPICFTSYGVIGENGCKQDIIIDWLVPNKINYHDLLAKKATFGCSTVMIDSSAVGKIKMPSIRTGQDYATWLSILKKGFTAYSLKEILSFYRIVPGSISRNKFNKAIQQWRIYRNLEILPLRLSIFYFINYAFNAVFRK
jgi:teichuronic acid biosynthesis glycosyltransferase TuaG